MSSWAKWSRSGRDVRNLEVGDRVVVPFPIACGRCSHANARIFALRKFESRTRRWPRRCGATRRCGIFGYSHMLGGYAGGQAEYARVPFADVGPIKIPEELADEQVLFLSDIFPTGYMAAENCDIQPGDTSPSGAAGRSGCLRSRAPTCSAPSESSPSIVSRAAANGARTAGAAKTINYEEVDVLEVLEEMTGGRGPDPCIDAVGWKPTRRLRCLRQGEDRR